MRCTWKNCTAPGKHPHKNHVGRAWCNLCDDHHADLTDALNSGAAPRLLQAWVLAKGGSEKVAKGI